MELLSDLGLADLGMTGFVLAVVVVAGLALLLPLSAYAAQKWAYKTYLETRSVNEKLTRVLELMQPETTTESPPTPASVTGKHTTRRREPTLGNTDI